MSELQRIEAELQKKAEAGPGSTSMEERTALGYMRCAAFTKATQNKGTPGCRGSYGTGKAGGE